MTTIGDRFRARAARPFSLQELLTVPGFLAARLLRVGDLQRLLLDVVEHRGAGPAVLTKRSVRRRLWRMTGGRGTPPEARRRVVVRVPEWSAMGRSFFGMHENYYDPVETEILALLALWSGDGLLPRPGSSVLETSWHPRSDAARDLLLWRELDDTWTDEQFEILGTLLRDGVGHEDAIAIARNPGW